MYSTKKSSRGKKSPKGKRSPKKSPKKSRCKKDEILRRSYYRKSYTRNGKRISSSYVRSSCIRKSRKKSPKKSNIKSPKKIGKLNKGTLTRFGYSADKSMSERRESLSRAIKAYGSLVVFRKLNAIYVLNRNTVPKKSQIFYKDRNWVKRNFM